MLDATAEPVERTRVVNGVAVPGTTFDEARDTDPDHERTVVRALRRYVRRGDRAVVVGGGWGTTAVVAARMTHYEGELTVYEPSPKMLTLLERTLRVNDVSDLTTVEHAAVGSVSDSSERLFGAATGGAVAPPDLPACDVLELDCEGAELDVLRGLVARPRLLLVEVHPHLGPSCGAVASELAAMGYEVVDRDPADAPGEITTFVALHEST